MSTRVLHNDPHVVVTVDDDSDEYTDLFNKVEDTFRTITITAHGKSVTLTPEQVEAVARAIAFADSNNAKRSYVITLPGVATFTNAPHDPRLTRASDH